MKTIKERAALAADAEPKCGTLAYRYYKQGAVEQQAIDIDNACNAYCVTRCGYINAENCNAKPCACLITFKELMKGE